MPVSLEVRHPAGPPVGPFEPVRAEAALLHGLAATSGYTRWIDGGTLLGLKRDRQFIGHDTDVDIAVAITTDQALELQLPSGSELRTIRWNHLPMQHAYLEDGIIVDLYFYYSDIEPGNLVNVNSDGVLRIPANLIFPIDEGFTWNGHQLPVPNLLPEYLEWSYGGSWQTPAGSKGNWAEEHANLDDREVAAEWKLARLHERIAAVVRTIDDERREALAERDLAHNERDRAIAERDQAYTERDVALVERAEMRRQRNSARRSAKRSKARLKQIQRSHAWRAASRYYSARHLVGRAIRRTKD